MRTDSSGAGAFSIRGLPRIAVSPLVVAGYRNNPVATCRAAAEHQAFPPALRTPRVLLEHGGMPVAAQVRQIPDPFESAEPVTVGVAEPPNELARHGRRHCHATNMQVKR